MPGQQPLSDVLFARAAVFAPTVAACGNSGGNTRACAHLLVREDVMDVRALDKRVNRGRIALHFENGLVNLVEPQGLLWRLFTPWHADDLDAQQEKNRRVDACPVPDWAGLRGGLALQMAAQRAGWSRKDHIRRRVSRCLGAGDRPIPARRGPGRAVWPNHRRPPDNRTTNQRPTRGKPQQTPAAMTGLMRSWKIAISAPSAAHIPNTMPRVIRTAPTPLTANRSTPDGPPGCGPWPGMGGALFTCFRRLPQKMQRGSVSAARASHLGHRTGVLRCAAAALLRIGRGVVARRSIEHPGCEQDGQNIASGPPRPESTRP